MNHSLPTETINKVLGYLATKAFSEVSELINEIRVKAVPLPIAPVAEVVPCEAPVVVPTEVVGG